MASHAQLRIMKEITNLQKGSDLSLAVAFREDDLRKCRALIIGPPETPYEFGFFEFFVTFGKDYPTSAPVIRAVTTNQGGTRFNPNIYADGKVCLSILGTWRGEPGEEWSSAQGLESILISIQSLMSSNPYENEPGYEKMSRAGAAKDADEYVFKIRHESLRIAVAQRLEDFLGLAPMPAARFLKDTEGEKRKKMETCLDAATEDEDDEDVLPFADLCKRRFLWYYSSYLAAIDHEMARPEYREGAKFRTMEFELPGNTMNGVFGYKPLRARFEAIHAAINTETAAMEAKGLESLKSESPQAFAFQNRLKHLKKSLEKSDTNLELEDIDGNPFAWRLTLFGRPMTLLEGGLFAIKIVIPLDFPTQQPRVRVETPMFHQRVAVDGTLCYFPAVSHEIESHVAAIIAAIQDESPPYDPRTLVNLEASKLLWGSEADKKTYRRNLRRSAERSSEM